MGDAYSWKRTAEIQIIPIGGFPEVDRRRFDAKTDLFNKCAVPKGVRDMSALGHSRLAGQGRRSYLSAVTPKADKRGCSWIVRFVPEADIA